MADSKNSSLFDFSGLVKLVRPKVALVKTEWNKDLVSLQTEGAYRMAQKHDVVLTHDIAVPGCIELPFAIRRLYESVANNTQKTPEAIIAFGVVIRGGTPHFDYVCQTVTEGVLQLNLQLPIPVIFGILTLEHLQQGLDRLGGINGHKGEEAMISALKMIHFNRMMRT